MGRLKHDTKKHDPAAVTWAHHAILAGKEKRAVRKIMSCPIMKPPVVANISFFPNPRLEKEDLRGTYGECGQKSIIESDSTYKEESPRRVGGLLLLWGSQWLYSRWTPDVYEGVCVPIPMLCGAEHLLFAGIKLFLCRGLVQ
ncbi:hypothetical protein BDA96_03G041000 [Sorghum bicolor]|uniref:Uncharacterized protein n=1 Tax=Sorghum bicolor TaxID=4558 RepID=A0A921R9Y1_SORBI|nr:hypothetical protein BDA96_03G041000 [Sorghum bicolor]